MNVLEQSLYWVFAEGPEGRYDDFKSWYHTTHIIEVGQHPLMVRAAEYEVESTGPIDFPRHLGLYQINSGDPMAVVEDLRKGTYTPSGLPTTTARTPRLFTTVTRSEDDARAAVDQFVQAEGFQLLLALKGEGSTAVSTSAVEAHDVTWSSEGLEITTLQIRTGDARASEVAPGFAVDLLLTKTCEHPGPAL